MRASIQCVQVSVQMCVQVCVQQSHVCMHTCVPVDVCAQMHCKVCGSGCA